MAIENHPDRVSHLPVRWVGPTRQEIRALPEWARERLGKGLHDVQCGHEPPSWRAMAPVGQGCREVRARQGNNTARLFYLVRGGAVYALIAFVKKDERTAHNTITVAKKRYAAAVADADNRQSSHRK